MIRLGFRGRSADISAAVFPPAADPSPAAIHQAVLGPNLFLYFSAPIPPPQEAILNITVSACIRAIASAVAVVPPRIVVGGVPADDHPASRIFDDLAPETSWAEMVHSMVADYIMTGQILLHTDGKRLTRLPAALIRPVPRRSPDGRLHFAAPIHSFALIGEGTVEFPAEEIAWVASRRSDRPWEVIPPVRRLAPLIAVDNMLDGFFDSYIRNGGMTPFLLISEVPLPESRIEEFKRRWQERSRHEMEMGIPPVLSRMRVERLGNSVRDMGLDDIRMLVETKICSELGVPPIIIGAISGLRFASYANYRTALIAFRQLTVVPFMRRVADALTAVLRRRFPEVDVDYDWRMAEAVMGDRLETARLYESGLLTIGEARAELGYPPSEYPIAPVRPGRRVRNPRPGRTPGQEASEEPSNDFIGRKQDYPERNGRI